VVAVVGIAGATETGSIDDLEAISKLCQKYKVHFHVDAAWGGPVIFSKKHNHMMKGIEQADTITLDGHKQLYMPMGCGLCFFKNPTAAHAVRKTARYIIRKDSHDLGKFTMEGSRPANAVFLHANLNILGVSGFGTIIDRCIRIVAHMVSRVDNSDGQFELVVRPMTNILLYRALPKDLMARANKSDFTDEENARINEFNVKLQTAQKLEGRSFVSRTTVKSVAHGNAAIVALRVVIANMLTKESDIDAALADQVRLLAKIN